MPSRFSPPSIRKVRSASTAKLTRCPAECSLDCATASNSQNEVFRGGAIRPVFLCLRNEQLLKKERKLSSDGRSCGTGCGSVPITARWHCGFLADRLWQ